MTYKTLETLSRRHEPKVIIYNAHWDEQNPSATLLSNVNPTPRYLAWQNLHDIGPIDSTHFASHLLNVDLLC